MKLRKGCLQAGWVLLLTAAVGHRTAQGQGTANQHVPAIPAVTPSRAAEQTVRLTVQVETKSGAPVTGLTAGDLTVQDNGAPVKPLGFRAVARGQEPVEVIVVFDSVNSRFETVAYERDQVRKFLQRNTERLGVPMTFAVLSDKGLEIAPGVSTDPAGLSKELDQATFRLREITRAAGFWGADERLQISLNGIQEVAQYAGKLPGRKLVLWLSPGWPLLSGPGVQLDDKQQRQIFNAVVAFSRELRDGNVTLYSINPLGAQESLLRENYYTQFVHGIDRPGRTDLGDLGVQVLALQSGGLALNSTGVSDMITRCLDDAQSWYEVELQPGRAEKPDQYHHVQINVDRPGATVRTRDGYYAQP